MLFNIAPTNAERVKKEFTATRPEQCHGYFQSVILTSPSRFYTYRIDMICGYYCLTVRTRDKEQVEIIAFFEQYKPGSIAVTKGELYKNGSGYPYRIEKSERYLKKYDQLACIVHGAIAAGLLFDTVEAPTTEETSEAAQDTACTDKEPQEGTETAQKTTDMETFKKAYSAAYTALYDHCGEPETDEKERYYCTLFDQEAEAIADTVRRFCAYRGDLVSSDREAAAFMIALETVGTPTDGKTATDGETTTTTETDAQRATETPRKTIRTGERLYSHPHRHMVTVEGLQGELVSVFYKGRLYLVCCSDLYTDETETTPAMLPPQDAESAGTTAGGKSITTTTECAQEAPQTDGTSEGGSTTTPPNTAPPRATDEATDGKKITTPASDPRQPDGKTITGSGTDGGKAITGDTDGGKNITTPGNACENAPGRTERAQAAPTTTPPNKRPPRGKYKATHARPPALRKIYAKIRVHSGALYFTGAG